VARIWLFSSLGLGLVAGVVFAVFPSWDLDVAELFFKADASKFTHAFSQPLNAIRGGLNLLPWLLAIPPITLLVLKLIFPAWRMPIAPSVVIYLVASFVIGPGLFANVMLKENWGRPRPNQVEQFGGTAHFQPWWRSSSECPRNCSFVSGEASQGFWLVAPASLAPPQLRPVAMGGAVVYGATVGGLRMVFGRHFLTDILFSGVITIAVVMALYLRLIDPARRNDERVERAIVRMAVVLHRGVAAILSGAGFVLTKAGGRLRAAAAFIRHRIALL